VGVESVAAFTAGDVGGEGYAAEGLLVVLLESDETALPAKIADNVGLLPDLAGPVEALASVVGVVKNAGRNCPAKEFDCCC